MKIRNLVINDNKNIIQKEYDTLEPIYINCIFIILLLLSIFLLILINCYKYQKINIMLFKFILIVIISSILYFIIKPKFRVSCLNIIKVYYKP